MSGQVIRPVTGVWPPCPPPCPPVDCMSGLEKCYEDVKRAKAFLKQMLIDIINEDPDIIGRGTPIIGVTDGSAAQPGMVGEFIQWEVPFSLPVATATQNVSVGTLPAGDWDMWSHSQLSPVTSPFFSDLQWYFNPLPAGFSGSGYALIGIPGEPFNNVVIGPMIQALTSVPSLIALTIISNTVGNGAGVTTGNIWVNARRRR